MSENEKLLENVSGVGLFDLPIGVYVVTREGQIVGANKQARDILKLPPEGDLDVSILPYYYDPDKREKISLALEDEKLHGRFLSNTLRFKIKGREVYVRDSTRSIYDPATGAVLGYVCCIIDVTEQERFRQVSQNLLIGFYVLDAQDRIEYANEALAQLLGYDGPRKLIGRSFGELYVDPAEAQELRLLVEREDRHADHITQVLTNKGEPLFVRVITTRITSPETGEYKGREGFIVGAETERYRRILDLAPIGLYEVQYRNGEDRIIHCNDGFAAITGFERAEAARSFDMKKLFASREGYDRMNRALEESGRPHNQEIRIRTVHAEPVEKVVEVSVSALLDRRHNIIGRIGAVRDITEARHEITELAQDIGNYLHAYSHNLLEIKLSIDAIIDSLKPDPFTAYTELLPEVALEHLAAPARQVAENVSQLSALAATDKERRSALPETSWEQLSYLGRLIGDYEKNVTHAEFHLSAIRDAVCELVNICDQITSGRLPRELVRDTRAQALDVLRILNLFVLHRMLDGTLELGHQLGAVREFALSGERVDEPRSPHKIPAVLDSATMNVIEFARKRGVRFRRRVDCPDVLVEIVERDVVRALANILHNAIKYSWQRTDSHSSFVNIRAYLADDKVHIGFENYGVPIPREEIEQGMVFRLGYRGKVSTDRRRDGSGVGLTDSQRVARMYGGDVTIESKPAVSGKSEDDLDQPFRTTVTFILPVQKS